MIQNANLQYHIRLAPGDVGEYVILPGDPGRVPAIAAHLDDAREIAYNREYRTMTGTLEGKKVSVVSTGIGGPSAAIAMEELVKLGAKTFIRVGSSGGMALPVMGGDIVVATAATRSEGTSREYTPEPYPAVADFSVTSALWAEAQSLSQPEDGRRCHVGVVHCKDAFYGETEPETIPVGDRLRRDWDAYVACDCLTSEMESAALFSVAAVRHVRCGSVLAVYWNPERLRRGLPDTEIHSTDRAIRCAIGAIRRLIREEAD